MVLGSLKVTLCLLFIYLYRQLFLSGSPDRKPIFLFLLFKNNDLIWFNLFPAKSVFDIPNPLPDLDSVILEVLGHFFPVTAVCEKQLFAWTFWGRFLCMVLIGNNPQRS